MSICGYMINNQKIISDNKITNMCKAINKKEPNNINIQVNNNVSLGVCKSTVKDILYNNVPFKLSYSNKTYVIAFNGELCNSNELKKKLEALGYKFIGLSDAETILASYLYYNKDFLDLLNGSYSFSIHCIEDNYIFLARDRLGIKPLYYSISDDSFIFSSDLNRYIILFRF